MYKALRFHNYYGADFAARRPVIDDEGLTERSTTPAVRHVGQLTYRSSRGVRRDGLGRILRSCRGSLCENGDDIIYNNRTLYCREARTPTCAALPATLLPPLDQIQQAVGRGCI